MYLKKKKKKHLVLLLLFYFAVVCLHCLFLGKCTVYMDMYMDYGYGLQQGFPLSLVLFIIFMDRISRRNHGPEGVWFGSHRISSLLFLDNVVLLAPSSQDLQHVLGQFAAECEAAGMRISTSKSEAMVLDRKKVACSLRFGGEFLPQVQEFKCLGFLFKSEGRMECETDRRIGCPLDAFLGRCSWHALPRGDPEEDPGHLADC